MFSVTTTRFIASLAMTLLLWLTCSTGAVAADPVNPDPCTDLWDCIYPPILGGTTAGSAMICQNKTGTWSISDLVTPGYKERCGKKKHPGIRSASGTGNIDWKWKVEGAKNFSEEGVGKTFDKSYSEPGDYKITWVGSALTDDKGEVNECEKPADVTVNDTFKVILEERLFSVQPKSPSDFDKAFCLGEKRTGTFTIKDYSQCFQGPYVVKWHIEKSGDPTVTVTPTEGEITIESDLQEISVPVDVSVANPTVAGQVKLTFIGVNEYQTQSTEVTVTVKKPDYVAKFDIGDQKICRSKTLDVPFTITNRGCPVDEVVTWSVELKAGGSLPLTLANNRGVTLVAPGTPFKGIIQVSCDEAPLSGAVTLKLKATAPSNSNGVTDSFDISLSQPSISGDVESGMACIGEQLVVSAFVKNDSDCDELIKWRVQKIGGFLQVELAENTGVEVLPAHTPLIKMVTVNIDPLSPNGKAELQLTVEVANQVVFTSGNASNGIIHDTASPNEGVAIGPGAPLATLVPSESDHSDPVKFTIGHSIITNDTPRKRELKGKLRLTYKSGDRDSINLFKANGQPYTLGTPIEVLEVGHEGCGRHDWHLGNVGMGFIGKKIGEVVLTASVTPDLDDGGQGRATITSDITFRVIKPDIVPTVPKFAECLKNPAVRQTNR